MKKIHLSILAVLLIQCGITVHASTTLTVATTADGTGTSPLTLRAAINEANTDIIASHFPYIIKVPAGTYSLTQRELPIGRGVGVGMGSNVIILGTGTAANTIINQTDGTSRVFDLDPNSLGHSVFGFANLTISGGNDTFADAFGLKGDGGGGILTGDAGAGGDMLDITNCIFENNTSSGEAGGSEGGAAVSSSGGKVYMVGCVFTNNTLVSSATNLFFGAAVYFVAYDAGDNLTAVNCVFLNNKITGSVHQGSCGGALAVDNGDTLPVANITNCVFGGNSVTSTATGGPDEGGGAVYCGGGSSNNLISCTFTNNQANGNMTNGGAIIALEGTTNLIQYCRFLEQFRVRLRGAGSAIHLNAAQGPFNANDNWWGANSGPPVGAIAGTNTSNAKAPTAWLFLTNTSSASSVPINGTATLTASFLKDSAGTAIAAANLTALTNVAVSFAGIDGSISGAQTLIQASGTATATFTGTVAGNGGGTASFYGVSSTASITVLNGAISVSSSPTSQDYRAGQTVPIMVTFGSAVTVTGTPELALSDGGIASYSSGSGTAILTFNYLVAPGDTSSHLDYASTTALTLNGGTITAGGGAVTLTLPSPGAAGSLGANTTIIIDTTPPVVMITTEPSFVSGNPSPSFAFTATDTGSGLTGTQYRLDSGSLANATSPVNLTGLADGSHVFTLKATDNAGNVGSANYVWTVDTTPPTVTISGPSPVSTNAGGSVAYTVTYYDLNFSSATLTPAKITLTNGAVTGTITVVTNNATNFTVLITNLAGFGAQAIQIVAGTATDDSGQRRSGGRAPAKVSPSPRLLRRSR